MGGCRWRLSGHFLKNDIIQMKQTQLRIFIGQPFLPYAIERVEGLSCLHWSILQRWVNLFSLSQHLSHFRANLAAAHMFAVGEFHKAVKKKRKPSFISFLSPCSNSSAWPSRSSNLFHLHSYDPPAWIPSSSQMILKPSMDFLALVPLTLVL